MKKPKNKTPVMSKEIKKKQLAINFNCESEAQKKQFLISCINKGVTMSSVLNKFINEFNSNSNEKK